MTQEIVQTVIPPVYRKVKPKSGESLIEEYSYANEAFFGRHVILRRRTTPYSEIQILLPATGSSGYVGASYS